MNDNNLIQMLAKNKISPIIFIETPYSNVDNVIFSLIKTLNCNQSETYCNECINCKKINNLNYYDLKIIDGYNSSILKDDVYNTLQEFNNTSLESAQNKFLIIKGFENASKHISNLLLTTIENPQKNTYYFFTTKNINNILDTIKSRCQIYKIESNKEMLENLFEYKNLTLEDKKILIEVYKTYNEIKNVLENESFFKLKDIYNKIKNNKLKFGEIKVVLEEFKKLSYLEIGKLISFFIIDQDVISKMQLSELINETKLNINKTLIYNKLLSIIYK